MLAKEKLCIIHIAKNKLKLSDDEYRDILSRFGVKSSKELDNMQFDALMNFFERLGFVSNYVKVKKPVNKHNPPFASDYQIAKIKAMWNEKSKTKTEKSLERFVFRITGKINLTVLVHKDIMKIIKALENLK